MEPTTTAALIGAGSSILGGILGGDKFKAWHLTSQIRANARAAEVMPTHIRKGAEDAGYNPLTVLGSGQSYNIGNVSGMQSGAAMGAAIADAGMILADAVAKKGQNAQVTALEAENKKLAEKVQSLTLRPKVGGIYAGQVRTPTTGAALGVSNGSAVSQPNGGANNSAADGAADGLRPLANTLPVDPRREVENDPQKTSSGFMVVDNPYLPAPMFAPTLDGDEPLQWYDYPSLALPAATMFGQYAYQKGKDFASSRWKSDLQRRYAQNGGQWVDPTAKPPRPRARPKYQDWWTEGHWSK